jgi:glutamate synthase (NADPH/NADH) small chain
MDERQFKDGVVAGRLNGRQLEDNFSDMHPPLDKHEALVAADRCYFCHDAPCVTACPTGIDIPLFIRQISTGNPIGSANTIFDQNIMGGMCARVCPTETLCEEACVRELAEGKPVQIGLLQRYATDAAMAEKKQFYKRAPATGKSIAVIGAGPAGLACAHRLAMHGHEVVIHDAGKKPGGLNEYGIASYKAVNDFAQAEIDYILEIGGITIRKDKVLGKNLTLAELQEKHDAVFLAMGLSGVNDLGLKGGQSEGIENATDFIAELRQAKDKSRITIGRRVVVIGGGMTAIDCAVQAKLLGAEQVTICYRRGREDMNASLYEQEHATANGVVIRHWLAPVKISKTAGKLTGIEMEYTSMKKGKLTGTGQMVKIPADQVFSAIGQSLNLDDAIPVVGKSGGKTATKSTASLRLDRGRIAIDKEGHTSIEGIWAGGDCTNSGEDLTVTAVAQGRDAAESIHRALG